jgi:5-methylcytosine-specific restriction endonuclease McrA
MTRKLESSFMARHRRSKTPRKFRASQQTAVFRPVLTKQEIRAEQASLEIQKAAFADEVRRCRQAHLPLSEKAKPVLDLLQALEKQIEHVETSGEFRKFWIIKPAGISDRGKAEILRLCAEHDTAKEQLRRLQAATSEPNGSLPCRRHIGGVVETCFSIRINVLEQEAAAIDLKRRHLSHLLVCWLKYEEYEKKQEEKLAKEARAKREKERLRGVVAEAQGRSRKLAERVKRTLSKQECCPYCGGLLGSAPHADHIYPRSKGGLSVEQNMVFVCETCNTQKSDLTLIAFIELRQLDRQLVEQRLRQLGKDF